MLTTSSNLWEGSLFSRTTDAAGATEKECTPVPAPEWRRLWNRRLRPYVLSENVRDLYLSIAISDSGQPVESIVRFHAALCALTGRQGIRDDVSRYEAVSMGLIDVDIESVGQRLPDYPPSESPLVFEQFFETLFLRYDERYVYSAPDLSAKTRRMEWSSDSPAFVSPVASSMDYEIRLAEEPGA